LNGICLLKVYEGWLQCCFLTVANKNHKGKTKKIMILFNGTLMEPCVMFVFHGIARLV